MYFIKDGKLIHNDTPFTLSSFHNTVEVVGRYPASSVVYCYINGYTETVRFPLTCERLTDEGYLFKGQVIINKKIADYMHKNPDKEFTFSFKFNNEPIEGTVRVLIHYESVITYLNNIPEPITQLLNSVNQLSTRLDAYMFGKTTNRAFNLTGVKKGMSPIAIDNTGKYVWDYPFAKEKEYIKTIATILETVSEELKTLNKRVEAIEQKVTDHIYETYEL